MKQLILFMSLVLSFNAFAQDADKTVTLVVSGQGKTQDEAKQNALRSAIEQAFGTFISSKTEILNDNLVKDEIVSITNGNIQKYEIISEVKIPEGVYATTLKAIVSVSKLTSFCESKGVKVEIQGGLFVQNIKLQQINENSELQTIINICSASLDILSKSVDFDLNIYDPIATNSKDTFEIPMDISIKSNNNIELFYQYFNSSLKSISMPPQEVENYNSLNKKVYKLKVENLIIYLRNEKSFFAILNFLIKSNKILDNFIIASNIDTFNLYSNNNRVPSDRVGFAQHPWAYKPIFPTSIINAGFDYYDRFEPMINFYREYTLNYFLPNKNNIDSIFTSTDNYFNNLSKIIQGNSGELHCSDEGSNTVIWDLPKETIIINSGYDIGFGFRFENIDEGFKILEIIDGSNAFKDGRLKVGDIIQKVADVSYEKLKEMEEAVNNETPTEIGERPLKDILFNFFRSEEGAKLNLTVKHIDSNVEVINLTQGRINKIRGYIGKKIREHWESGKGNVLDDYYTPKYSLTHKVSLSQLEKITNYQLIPISTNDFFKK